MKDDLPVDRDQGKSEKMAIDGSREMCVMKETLPFDYQSVTFEGMLQ
jgi:hypothetical protein